MVQTVAQYIIRQLGEWGVHTAFGLPGDSFFPLVDALAQEQSVDFYIVRNETAAGYMASACSKISGKPALCLADGGPGAVNLLNGLFDATNDGVPVIALTGQVERRKMFTSYIQSSDQNDIFKEATIFSATVLVPEMTGQLLERAYKEAVAGSKAVHLAIPKDVQSMEYKGAIIPPPVFKYPV
ncbi:MAG TPA: thiamine pyrophosphate-binding protein, partial [Clostridia bacterium]|nr:thiamine pyrophosphate-binding protein [Clostridia bacterium]